MLELIVASVLSASQPADFSEAVGRWQVLGDTSVGACLVMPVEDGSTSLAIVAPAASSEITFVLRNDAWMSVETGDVDLTAAFFNEGGSLRDLWRLSAVGVAHDAGGPLVRFSINRSRNDSESFAENLGQADGLGFFIGKVPIATFDLDGSKVMLDKLRMCRSTLRINPDFDPFADGR